MAMISMDRMAAIWELKNGKLITKKSRYSGRKGSFSPRSRMGHVGSIGHVGTVMIAGYEDFPDADSFR